MAKSNDMMTQQKNIGLGLISSLEMIATGTTVPDRNTVICDFTVMFKVSEYTYW